MFKDMDGVILQYGDSVIVVYGGLPIGRLVKGIVADIGCDYVEVYSEQEGNIFVYKSEQIRVLGD